MTSERIEQASSRIAESAFDFLARAVGELEEHPKYSVIHFATAVELLLKARLMNEHWSLVVEKSSEADLTRFLVGTCRTVSAAEAVRRLRKVCGQTISLEAEEQFSKLSAHRNRMIHFFHEAGAEAAAPETIQEVVLEQCRCWYHLRSLMRQWSEQFEDYEQTLMRIDWQMQRNRNFLQVKFDQIKTKIENDTKDGSIFADCSGCGFPAAELHEQSHILKDVICRVCGLDRGYLEIACPANCGGTIHIEADHGSERTCQKCNHVVETDELLAVLDT